MFQDPANTNTNSTFYRKYNVLSQLPLSPCQTSRESWKNSGSCQLQAVRDVFGACFSAGSVFPSQDLSIVLCKMVQLEDWGSTVYRTSWLLTLCSYHITAFCSADFPAFSTNRVVTDWGPSQCRMPPAFQCCLQLLLASQRQGMVSRCRAAMCVEEWPLDDVYR